MRFNTKQISSGSFLGTFTGSLQGTASWALNSISASYFSGSISNSVSSSYSSTSSFALNTDTASYALFAENANTASYVTTAQTASYYGGSVTTASYAISSSFTTNADTASYVIIAQTASYYGGSVTTASYAVSSSFAIDSISASYAINAASASFSQAINGGLQTYIPLWATNNTLTSSRIYQSGSSICISSSVGMKFGVTPNDFVSGFASNLPASVQINHGGSDYGLAITRYTNDASAANFTFYRTRGGSSSVKGALSDGTRIGAINILGVAADGTTTSVGGGFTWYGIPTNTGEAYGTGTPASSSMPILLDYRTVGFANTSEYIRMRLYPNGEFVFADSTGVIGLVKGVKMQIRGKALVENSLKIGAFEEASASFALDVTGSSKFIGDIQVTGSLYAPFITGSLEGTASYAITASYFSGSVSNAISASFAQTASYALNANSITSQISLGSVTASVNTDTSSFSVISGSTILFKINSSGSLNHGDNSSINGLYSHAEGFRVTASGDYSHAEGAVNIAFGNWSHVEGTANISSGSYSHAEGFNTRAVGTTSHTEGTVTISNGAYSHAEGNTTIAEGLASHAEGNGTIASGSHSHAEGIQTTARGDYSHAEGVQTISIGTYSHAEGLGTIASGSFQHAQGKYNTHNNTSSLMIIGNGVNASNRSDLALFNSESIVFNKPVTGSVFSGSFIGSITSASYSTTSSLPLLGIITASASNTTITFTKGDGTTFNVTVSQSGSVATASYALFAENANTASYVLNAVSSSFAQTASYYGGSVISASYALSSSQSQNANTASYVQLAQSASYATTASYALNAGILFTSSLATAATSSVIIAITTASYTAGFFDYTVYSGSNARAGTIMSVWNNISTEYTDNSTNDIGLTSDISFLVDLSGSLVRLRAITLVSQWNVKVTYRLI